MSGSHLLYPLYCTDYTSYSWCICIVLPEICTPSTYVLQHTGDMFPCLYSLGVCDWTYCT